MGARVAVAGASGYAGGELLRLLAGHPDLEIGVLTAGSSAGKTVGEVHAHLAGIPALAGRTFEAQGTASLASCDLVFAALPAGQSAVLARSIPAAVKIVDLGPDFRLADPAAWARYYGGEHPGRWVTGLPELPGMRTAIGAASRVAAPGCYATAAILALVPIVAAGLAQPHDVVVVAASGTSGAGRSLRASLLGSEVMGSVSAYAAGGAHRHTAEIEQALSELASVDGVSGGETASQAGSNPASQAGYPASQAGRGADGAVGGMAGPRATVSFTPVLAPMPRGILATCTARLTAAPAGPAGTGPAGTGPAGTGPAGTGPTDTGPTDTAALRAALAAAYAGEEFCCLLPEGRWPATASVAGSNGVHLQAAVDERAGRAVVVAAIDNLGKGAASQAVQNANLMLGLPEGTGLTASGVAP
jgi:N-acetyl-gamma-glutamyl-phosphate reductase